MTCLLRPPNTLETDHRKLDYGNFTDDEEVTLLPHKRDTEIPDNPGLDIRDGPDMSDTQRKDWLLQTEPLHSARPRRNERERPPVINGSSGGCGGRKVDQHGIQASAVTRAADLTGGGSDDTTEGGPSGCRASGATRRGASRSSDFYGGPSMRWWFRTDRRMLGRR